MRSLFKCFLFLSLAWTPFPVSGAEPRAVSVMILGGGIGALTSAIYLGRAELSPLVIEGKNPGGLLSQSHSVQNWPGELEVEGSSLTEKMRKQAEMNGCTIVAEEVVSVDFSKRPFLITTCSLNKKNLVHQYYAESCIIAMGTQPNHLGVPGELGPRGYWGKGVTNCAICDGSLYKDKVVGVVGGGDAAILEASYLSNIAKDVYVFVRKDQLKALEEKRISALLQRPNVRFMYNTQVAEIKGDGNTLKAVTLQTKGKAAYDFPLDGLFLAIGSTPNSQIFKGALDLDARGYICLKNQQMTSVEGVYAVGDIADPSFQQAVSAAGDGAKAALQLQQYLSDQHSHVVKNAKEKKKRSLEEKREVVEIYSLEQFEQVLETSEVPILVDFYATWCGPCKRIAPMLEEIAMKAGRRVNVLKVNVDKLSQLSRIYNIQAMPTALLFDSSGDVLERRVGYESISDMLEELEAKVMR